MEKLSIGSIVFVSFPFSDLSNSKLRPALVLASAQNEDWILCQITSKTYSDFDPVKITDKNLAKGSLKITSYIRPRKIFTAHSSIIQKKVAELDNATQQLILNKIIQIFKNAP